MRSCNIDLPDSKTYISAWHYKTYIYRCHTPKMPNAKLLPGRGTLLDINSHNLRNTDANVRRAIRFSIHYMYIYEYPCVLILKLLLSLRIDQLEGLDGRAVEVIRRWVLVWNAFSAIAKQKLASFILAIFKILVLYL